MKSAFYEWVLNPGYQNTDRVSLNQYFPAELKTYILDHIYGDADINDYVQMSRKELEIVIELFLARNISHSKL